MPIITRFIIISITWPYWQCQPPSNIKTIEFTTLSRGYRMHITINQESIQKATTVRNEDEKHERRLLGTEWIEIQDILDSLDLLEIPDLPSPTMDRAFDGARHSSITITTKEGSVYIHSFDDEKPHAKLEPLLSVIKKIERKGP